MAITYPLTLPDDGFTAARFGARFNNITTPSLTNVGQTVSKPGDLLVLEFNLPPKAREDAAAWQAFGMALRGSYGSFYGYDRSARTPRGIGTGGPSVNGASQTGFTLLTKGWTNSQTGIMLAGDWFGLSGRMHMVVEDADSSGAGLSSLEISPGIWAGNEPADSAAIIVNNPTAKFRLIDDLIAWDLNKIMAGRMSFKAVEDLRA